MVHAILYMFVLGAAGSIAGCSANTAGQHTVVCSNDARVTETIWVTSNAPVDVVRATGTGRPPAKYTGVRARLMARRAGEVIAVRNLARKVKAAGGRSRGFRYVKYEYHVDGRVTVTVETDR